MARRHPVRVARHVLAALGVTFAGPPGPLPVDALPLDPLADLAATRRALAAAARPGT